MSKIRRVTPVRYNAGNMIWYRREMIRMINAMNKDVRAVIVGLFDEVEFADPELANDANPVQYVKNALRQLSDKWMSLFISRATGLSTDIVDRTLKSSDRAFQQSLGQHSMRINMQVTDAMAERMDAIISENVSLIRSIPEKYFTEVEGMVYRAVAVGGDRKKLVNELTTGFSKRGGITRRRAINIANDQVRKATTSLSIARQQSAGITEGIWIHSKGQNDPRHKHVKADGKTFKLSEGLPVGDKGQYVLPAQEINCSCTWRPVVPF